MSRSLQPRDSGAVFDSGAIFSLVDQLEALLRQELDALRAGEVEAVLALTERKHSLIQEIQSLQDSISQRLQKRQARELQERLQALYAQLEENQQALERMITAVRAIATQFRQIQEQQQGHGLYGRRGRTMVTLTREKSEIDGAI